MIDLDRYDHTYCRVLKGEDVSCRRHEISTSVVHSDSVEQVIDFDPLLDHQIEVSTSGNTECENMSYQPECEPMIIVRTKRSRKPTPVIVKAFNVKSTTKDGYVVGTVIQSEDTTEVLPAGKGSIAKDSSATKCDEVLLESNVNKVIVKGIVHKKDADRIPDHAVDFDRGKARQSNDAVDGIASSSTKIITEQPQFTKSGRVRKLTEKAKQITEDSKQKAKLAAVKVSRNGGAPQKKKRDGRPAGKKSYFKLSGEDRNLCEVNKHVQRRKRSCRSDNPACKNTVTEGFENKAEKSGAVTDQILPHDLSLQHVTQDQDRPQPKSQTMIKQKHKTLSKQAKQCSKSSKTQSAYTVKMSRKSMTTPAAANTISTRAANTISTRITTQSSSSIRCSKKRKETSKKKVVAVLKAAPEHPSLRTRTINNVLDMTEKLEKIPAAKIDLSNIVRGSRKRK